MKLRRWKEDTSSQYRLTSQSVLAIGLTVGTLLTYLHGGKEVSQKHFVPADCMLEQADRSVYYCQIVSYQGLTYSAAPSLFIPPISRIEACKVKFDLSISLWSLRMRAE